MEITEAVMIQVAHTQTQQQQQQQQGNVVAREQAKIHNATKR
jgi:hypothetical protein